MVIDEPAMWNLIPVAKRERVMCVAKALCRSRDVEDDDLEHCGACDTPEGGSCVAFGLYGHMAVEVVEALTPQTSEEVVEAVARAIHDARFAHPDLPREPDPFDQPSDIEYATRLARAAIAAMPSIPQESDAEVTEAQGMMIANALRARAHTSKETNNVAD